MKFIHFNIFKKKKRFLFLFRLIFSGLQNIYKLINISNEKKREDFVVVENVGSIPNFLPLHLSIESRKLFIYHRLLCNFSASKRKLIQLKILCKFLSMEGYYSGYYNKRSHSTIACFLHLPPPLLPC